MKISDLTEKKKGPIIGAPKGSQSDARLSPGTDDPSKYMRGGEWEAYREPQGVNSNAGKIAGGKKKGTTKTKNKKVSEDLSNSIEYYSQQGLTSNPDREYVENLMQRAIRNAATNGARDPHLKGFYDPRGTFWIWDGENDSVHHSEIELSLVDRYGQPDLEDWMEVVGPSLQSEGVSEEQAEEYFNESGGFIPFIVEPLDEYNGGIGRIWTAFSSAKQQPAVQRALSESIRQFVEASILPPGGPGASGDLVPRDPHATTIAMVKDTAAPNIDKAPNLPGSEAPTKQVKKMVKKSYDNRPGNVSAVNERVNKQVDKIVTEAIPRVLPQEYSADYDLRDDKDQESIGAASISHGVIELLSVRNDVAEDFNGHIMSRLLTTIVRDADAANANLAIALDDPSDQQHKRLLERFGFRAVGKNIMKRNAGSVVPPSVPTARL